MKIDKRKCRQHMDLAWKIDRNNGLFSAKQVKYLIQTKLKNIGRQRLLVIYIYSKERADNAKIHPILTMFQSRAEYITLVQKEDGSVRWREAAFENLDRGYNFSNKCAFYTAGDEERVLRFCKKETGNGFSALAGLQRGIMHRRALEKQHKKERAILNRMAPVSALPRGLKSWVHHEIMPVYIFYDYLKGGKQMTGHCTACKKEMQVSGVKHNSKGHCPNCKREVTFKSRGRRGYIMDRHTVQVIQRLPENELLIRFIKVYRRYPKSDLYSESIFENARIFFSWGDQNVVTEDHYYYSYYRGDLTPWKKGDRPVYSLYAYNFEADSCGYLYYKNLDRELKGTPWQYSRLLHYYLGDPTPLYLPRYLKQYLRYPMLEYLVKLHLYRLTTDLVYGERDYSGGELPVNVNGKNIKDVLGIEKKYLPLLQEVNPGGKQLRLIKKLIRSRTALNSELLCWCGKNGIGDAESLVVPLQYMTPYKLMLYANAQFAKDERKNCWGRGAYYDMKSVLSDYRDYLCMSEALEFDLKNTFVLFPARLKEAHDKVNDLSDKETAEAYDRQVEKQFAALYERYHFSRYGYMIIPPRSAREVIDEGHKLHHCVGGYVKKVANRATTVLFVRRVNEPDQPFCTLEIKDYEVAQVRVYDNEAPPPDVQRFLGRWEKEVLQNPALPQAA